jgi:Domain of unknown function (DUF5666)
MPGSEIEFHEAVQSDGTGRVSASRFGILAAAAALMIVGVVAVMAAAPAPATGADPSAAANPNASAAPSASGAPGRDKDGTEGRPGPRGPFGLFGPSAGGIAGPFGLGGPGLGGGGIGFGDITITAIDGSNLSLKTVDGWTRTIAVTGSTTITKAGKTIALGDLAVGDHIRFGQQRESDGSYTITRIVVVLPTVAGQVSAVNGDTITVTQRGGTKATIHVDSSTTYQVNGTAGSLKDVKVGSIVIAEGTQRSDGSLDAAIVRTGDRAGGAQGPTWKREGGPKPGAAQPAPSSGTS